MDLSQQLKSVRLVSSVEVIGELRTVKPSVESVQGNAKSKEAHSEKDRRPIRASCL